MSCRHHWAIEPPNGPLSFARCKLEGCTAMRLLRNSTDDAVWKERLSTRSRRYARPEERQVFDGDGGRG